MRSKRGFGRWLVIAMLLGVLTLTACGGNEGKTQSDKSGLVQETQPVSKLTEATQHLVYIELDACYPPENATLTISLAEDKERENAIELTYNESIGGYMILLEEGIYHVHLSCPGSGVQEEQSRYLSIDGEHSYYHVRYTDRGYENYG